MPIFPSSRCCRNRCIICHGYAIHQQLPRKNAFRSRWKHLSMESFSMLFGLPVNHQLVVAMFLGGSQSEDDGKLCNRCFEDVSDVHHVFWQLHNLESKLIQLQNLLFQRLRENYDAALVVTTNNGKELETSNERIKVLFEEISLKKEIWPKGMYISRWKQAQENASKIQYNSDAIITDSSDVKKEPLEPETVHFETGSFDGDDIISFDDNYDDKDSDWDSAEDNVKLQRTKRSKKLVKSKKKKSSTKSSTKVPNLEDGVLRRFLCTVDPDICSRTYGRKKDLTKHIKIFHRDRKYVCDFEGCVEKFLSAKTLEGHKVRDHGVEKKKIIRCTVDPDICNKEYNTKSDLNEHIKEFHDGRIHACHHDECKEKFNSKLKLLTHQLKVHGYEKKKFSARVCHICGDSINSKLWKEHFRQKHVGNLDNACVRCCMNFETQEELENHEKLHNQVVNTLPFTCIIGDCQTVFSNSLDLKNHVMSVHLTWPECTVCGIRKPSDAILQIHMKTHQREKTVFCDQCPKAFYSEPALQNHKEDYHMGIKYTCETCGKEFTLKKSFIRHMRSHAGVKPFKCSICSKAFRSTQSLANHEATHSGVKNYPCQICGKRFKQVQNLRQHLNTQQHKGQKVEIPSQVFAQGVKMENVH